MKKANEKGFKIKHILDEAGVFDKKFIDMLSQLADEIFDANIKIQMLLAIDFEEQEQDTLWKEYFNVQNKSIKKE